MESSCSFCSTSFPFIAAIVKNNLNQTVSGIVYVIIRDGAGQTVSILMVGVSQPANSIVSDTVFTPGLPSGEYSASG